MPRGKKKKQRTALQNLTKKGGEAFNPLKGNLSSASKAESSSKGLPEKARIGAPEKSDSEDQYFLDAIADVRPLPDSKKTIVRHPHPNTRPAHPAGNEELEVMAHLSDLVSGAAELDMVFSDEYIEGAVAGFSPKLMHQLKKGQFPIQDHVDLHGLTQQTAEVRVREFLIESHRRGLRCVLIVHGRGLNSENQIPILKERLPVWLNRGPAKKIVLAFSTARPYDGGTGAIYVLLRRHKAETV
jgi:DNA-nicking Smr family endonuclease